MAKKSEKKLLEVIVVADEVVFQDKNYKQGDVFKIDQNDPVSEGLIGSAAVVDHADYKKQVAEMKKAEAGEAAEEKGGSEDGSR